MPDENKALVASSEFDPSIFITGIDKMTEALNGLSEKEDEIKEKLKGVNESLAANRKALKDNQDAINGLDKTSKTYTDDLQKLNIYQSQLRDKQKDLQAQLGTTKQALVDVNASANNYKAALQGITAVSRELQNQGKGKTIFDVATLNQQVQQITAIGGKLRDTFKGKLDTSDLEKLEKDIGGAKDEFQELAVIVDFVESKLDKLDPKSEEFADLTKIVATGKDILENYGQVVEQTEKKSKSLTGQLKAIREELARMEQNGEDTTEKFQELQIQAGKLASQINDTQERIRVLASDTRNLDFAIGVVRGIAGAFAVAEGAAALFGIKNEDVLESIQRLNAITAVLNGLQELQNLLKKQSVVMIIGETIAVKAYTIAQRILAVTLGTTAAASRGLAIALAATGIGLIVLAIAGLVAIMSSWGDETEKQIERQESLNFQLQESAKWTKGFITAIGDANRVLGAQAEVRQAMNEKVTASDLAMLRQRQKNAQELRDIDLRTLTGQLDEATKFENSLRANYEKAADQIKDIVAKKDNDRSKLLEPLQKTVDEFNKAQEQRFALQDALQIKTLNNQRDAYRDRLEIQRAELQATEDFIKRLEELRKRLLDAQNRQQRQDAAQLAKQAQANLNSELRAIDREVKNGTLTQGRGDILKGLLRQINSTELTTELKEFKKKSVDAQNSIEREIFNLRMTAGLQRTELLTDQLTREGALIEQKAEEEKAKLEQERNDMIRGVQDAFDQGLISPEVFKKKTQDILLIYAQFTDLVVLRTTKAQGELVATAFQLAQAEIQRTFATTNVFLSESTAEEIVTLARQYTKGSITYEKYQRELSRIAREQSQERIQNQLDENQALLDGVQARIKLEQDPTRLKALQDQEKQLRETIAGLRGQAAEGEAGDTKATDDENDARLRRIAEYAQAIGGVVDQVVQFWARANEAEQRQLDRSIALQERRVEAATRIAERGNAEYLRLEEDRLNELQVKQENAARRQLAINAVLQTSQALTAFVTALAQGIATGGPLGGIAIAAAVIGLIASGYAIIQSLNESNTPKLFKGSKYVTRDGHPAGRDTIPAMLNEGEAIVPTENNRKYKPAVEAIIDGAIPPEDMNDFVNSYRANQARIPGLDYDRIGEAATVVVTYDGKLLEATREQNRLTRENTDELRAVKRTLASMGISANVDKNGLAISLMQVVEQHKIDKKS